MTREEMINYLHKIDLHATPTVMTGDMGLQYDYITSEGAGTGFGGMGDWPAWRLPTLEISKWKQIRMALQNSSLSINDIAETGLDDIVEKAQETIACTPAVILKGLLDLSDELHGKCYYCFFDGGQWFNDTTLIPTPLFYTDEAKIKDTFKNNYVYSLTTWDKMSDDEVEYWYNRALDDLNQLTYYDYLNEEA